MNVEQSEYDELYDKGFEEQYTTVKSADEAEEMEEEVKQTEEQPEDTEEEEQAEEELDEADEAVTPDEAVSDSDEAKPTTRTLKYKGQELSLSEDERDAMAMKGFDYTAKTQDLAKNRADIELMTNRNLSHEDLVILADIKDGNKEALARLANNAGIDPLDVEDNTSYAPKIDNTNYELQDVVESIRSDADNGTLIDNWLGALPNSAKVAIADNPQILKGLHIDTISGVSKDIMPEVIKQLMLNPSADFVETYQVVGQKTVKQEANDEVKAKPEANRETKKKASVSKTKPSKIKEHQDVWDDDELYESMKAKLAKMR